jgi:protocatechuate 3,4-dioxygenase beta subunit
MTKKNLITRRHALGAFGVAGAGLVLGGRGLPSLGPDSARAATAACTLTPEQTEGPYYFDINKFRSNIASGKSGVPLYLHIYVVDSSSCEPIKSAAVDIWHCDAGGVYSDEAVQSTSGKTWLRGTQLTNSDGLAKFRTIYPGHYQGRTTHIHLKVHTGGHVSHTGQLFFTDALSKKVYKVTPYSQDAGSYQARNSDSVYSSQHGASGVMTVKRRGSSLKKNGLLGTITLGVDPSSTPRAV